MSRPTRVVLRFAVALLLAAAGCGRAAEAPGDVVLVTVDTLRADRLGLYGNPRGLTPHLDRWFADAAVFERAYATASFTGASVASFLSGRLPQDHGVRLHFERLPEGVPVITDLLPADYQSAAFVSNMLLKDEAIGFADRFDHYDERMERRGPRWVRRAGPTTDAALRWLREERDPSRPLLLWVHYMDPHSPYEAPEGWRFTLHHGEASPPPPVRVPERQRALGVEDPRGVVDRYDEEVAYTDAEIGRLLEGYAAGAPIEEALVLFTADHGETLIEHHPPFWHHSRVFEEIVRIPLLIRGPGVEPGLRRGLVSGIDLLPTIVSFAGGSLPAGAPGTDLRRTGGRDPDRVVFAESYRSQRRAAIQGDRKWVVRMPTKSGSVPSARVYDLGRDPLERRPRRIRSGAAPLRELMTLVEADSVASDEEVAPESLDPDRAEELRALGYLPDE